MARIVHFEIHAQDPAPATGAPVNGCVCTVDADDLDGCLQRVQQHGGTVAVAKAAVPGVGWLAYCRDTEENIFGVMQPDSAAS